MRYSYQIWRFVTPIFLHANFLHIFFNLVSTLILGSMIEAMVGTKKAIMIYFAAGIGGNAFSVLLTDAPAVGASTAITGLLGAYVAYILVNWKAMDYPGSPRYMMLCFALMIILFNLMFAVSGGSNAQTSMIDNYGHLGGLFAGFFAGMVLIDANGGRNGEWESGVRKYGYFLLIGYFVLCITLFYTVRKPACYNYEL